MVDERVVALFAAYSQYGLLFSITLIIIIHPTALYVTIYISLFPTSYLTITPSFLLIYFSLYYFLQYGQTPLYIACEKGHESTVLVLLQNGADPNLQAKVTSRKMVMIDDDNYDDGR